MKLTLRVSHRQLFPLMNLCLQDRSILIGIGNRLVVTNPLVQHQGLEAGLLKQQALEIMGIVFLCFLCLCEPVVEIAPLRASKFTNPQEHPSKNHKDLRVGNLVPNRVQRPFEFC
jgi:hypothetical protein